MPEEPAKLGRPSLYSQELADRICDQLSDGRSLRSICLADDMPAKITILMWLRSKPEFQNQYARAKDESADALADEIIDISDDSTNDYVTRLNYNGPNPERVVDAEHINRSRLRVDTRKWIASKLKPKKYGDLTQLQHSGSIEVTQQIEQRLLAGRKRASDSSKG